MQDGGSREREKAADGSADGSGRSRHGIWRFVWGIPGTVLTLSVIGAPLGLFMLRKAREHQRELEGGDVDRSTAFSTDRIREVIGLVLGRPPSPGDDSEEWRFDGSEEDRSR